jgi:hypothetical protein
MISIVRYISAKRRLNEADKTFAMLDGDVPPMMQAQRDMIKFELEFFKNSMRKEFSIMIVILLFVTMFFIYYI